MNVWVGSSVHQGLRIERSEIAAERKIENERSREQELERASQCSRALAKHTRKAAGTGAQVSDQNQKRELVYLFFLNCLFLDWPPRTLCYSYVTLFIIVIIISIIIMIIINELREEA